MARQRSTSTRTSVLVVSSSPDARASTAALRLMVEAMERRPDAEVSVWFLRKAWDEELWDGSRLVDALRTWLPARLLERAGVGVLAGRLRGARLRWWLRGVSPDIVVLDDGLGERLLNHLPSGTVIIERVNAAAPRHVDWEVPLSRVPDVVLGPAGHERPDNVKVVAEHPLLDLLRPDISYRSGKRYGSDSVRADIRRRHGLPTDVPLVVGWGDDGWLDGTDLFVRCLWLIEHRHGTAAHGLWIGSMNEPSEVAQLRAEAERCGLSDRFHHRPTIEVDLQQCGDAVFLPYRGPADPDGLWSIVASGAAVATFPIMAVPHPTVATVAHLDLDAAAEWLATELEAGRTDGRAVRQRAALRLFDTDTLIDELLATARNPD